MKAQEIIAAVITKVKEELQKQTHQKYRRKITNPHLTKTQLLRGNDGVLANLSTD